MSVEVKLELGHRACLREKPTAEGFTHDWTVFVKGPGSGAEANSIQHFVDKVVFYLHESFPKPKRVIKEPPYQVSESGYASFIMPIEVFFRSKEEPKKVCFEYDLYLRIDGPPVSNIRYEKLTFQNPTEDFRRKLITAGGHLLGASGPTNPPPVTEHHVEDHRSTGSLKLPAASGEKKRHHSATKEISKPAPPPPPPPLLPPPAPSQQPFNEIFGSPINKPKHSLGSTSKTKEHSHSGPKSGKTVPVASANKEAKLPSKETVSEAKESRSTKPPKQEKEPKPVKRVSPVQAHSDSTPPEKKRRTSSSSHDEKSDGAAKQKVREVKDREKHKTKSSSIAPAKREKDKTKNKSLTPPPKNKEPTKSPKLSAPAQRTDKYPSPLMESSSQEVCNSDASSKSSKPDEPVSPVPSTISESNKVSRPLSALYDEGDDSLLSPMSSDEENVPHPAKEKEKKEDREISDSGNVQTSKTKPPTKTSSASEKKAVKQKSSAKSTKEYLKPAHSENHTTKDSHCENQTSNSSEKETKQKKPVSSSNISELVELQQKIMTLKDRNIMQRIVDVIEKTGQYHMTSSSFDFDLCSLDDSTLRKLTCLFVK